MFIRQNCTLSQTKRLTISGKGKNESSPISENCKESQHTISSWKMYPAIFRTIVDIFQTIECCQTSRTYSYEN